MSRQTRTRETTARSTRRDFLKKSAIGLGAATAAIAAPTVWVRSFAAGDPLRTMGIAVSVINDILNEFTTRTGIPIVGTANPYNAYLQKGISNPKEWDTLEGDYQNIALFWPVKSLMPLETKWFPEYDKISDLVKKGRLKPEFLLGQGNGAPRKNYYVDSNDQVTMTETNRITAVPMHHNVDSLGYNPEAIGYTVDTWGELYNPKWRGKVALVNIPAVGSQDAALGMEALGLVEFKDKGNLSREEIDILIDYLIERKKEGHFRAFWNSFGESVNLMTSGEVVIQSMWSPAVTAVRIQGLPCIYADMKEGYRAWHDFIGISSKIDDKMMDKAIAYINFWLDGWPGAYVGRQGYYHPIPENVRKYMTEDEFDYWYLGEPAAEALPLLGGGDYSIPKGEVRDGGSYERRFSKVSTWNSNFDENAYMLKMWNEFLAA